MSDSSFEPKLTDLKVGYTFDYNLKSWIVEEIYHYKWGNNFTSKEYKIYSGDEEAFLEVEDDDVIKILFSKKASMYLNPNRFGVNSEPIPEIEYEGKKYYINEKFEAQARNDEDDYWESFVLFDYYDETGEEVLSIENWDGDIEISIGNKVNELEISNILKGDYNRARDRNIQRKQGHDTTYSEDDKRKQGSSKMRIIIYIIIIFIVIIILSRNCNRNNGFGGATYIHTGNSGRYHIDDRGRESKPNNIPTNRRSGGFRGGGGGFGK